MSKCFKCVFIAVCVLFSSLFSIGELPETKVEMPQPITGEYTQWVDPFIGTGGIPWVSAMLSPATNTPFAMVRLPIHVLSVVQIRSSWELPAITMSKTT